MRVLALDTATEGCSVALADGEAAIGRRAELARGHAEAVLDMVREVLAVAGYGLAGLDAVVASVGPGAFTGVRVGVSIAQGLAFGADLPVVPVTTLEALAAAAVAAHGGRALACLDARMGEVYWACLRADAGRGVEYEGRPAVGPPASVRLAGAAVGIGRGFAAHPGLATLPGLRLAPGAERVLPDAREMALLGGLRLARGEGRDAALLQPLYLRDHVALTEAERREPRPDVSRK